MYQRHVGAAVPVAVAADIDVDDEVVVIDVPSSEGGWMLLEKKIRLILAVARGCTNLCVRGR